MFEVRFRLITYTHILIAVNILFFVISTILAILLRSNLSALVLLGGESKSLVIDLGQYWRLVASGFLHVNIIHLLFNLYALWNLGNFVENFFGKKQFLFVYVSTMIISGLFSIFTSSLLNSLQGIEGENLSVGASGAIFGLLGLIAGNLLINKRYSATLPIDKNALFLIVGYNLVFGFMVPGINNAAHIGGLISGFLLAFIVDQSLNFGEANWKKKVVEVGYWLSLVALFSALIFQIAYAVLAFA